MNRRDGSSASDRSGSTGIEVLHKQALNYFNSHASQRLTVFNFYIALSSFTAAGYFASFKPDSNLESARLLLAFLLCFFSFLLWMLDRRVKVFIKIAERALIHFESLEPCNAEGKVFTLEDTETKAHRKIMSGWHRAMFWRIPLSYSKCFNLVYLVFFLIGACALLCEMDERFGLHRLILRAFASS